MGAFGYMRSHKLRGYHIAGPTVLTAMTLASAGLSKTLAGALRSVVADGLATIGLDMDTLSASPDAWYTETLLWGASKLDWILEWGVSILVFWLKLKLIKYVILTVMAPVMSALAGAVRRRETGHAAPFTLIQLAKDVLRGIRMSVVLLAAEMTLTLAVAITSLLLTAFASPLALLMSPALLFLSWAIGAYFYGAAVFDAVYEQDGLGWRSSLRQAWTDRGRLLGIGAVFSLLLSIPYGGVLFATLLGPIPCTVAAGRLTYPPHHERPFHRHWRRRHAQPRPRPAPRRAPGHRIGRCHP